MEAEMSTGSTLAERNATHFNDVSPGEWPDWVRSLHKQIVDFLTSPDASPWLGLPTLPPADGLGHRMLDYACGDGVISKALKPHFASVVGVDVSSGMLEKYRATASELNLGPAEMMGVCGDLLADDIDPADPIVADEKLWNFDLVATSMAMHHFDDPCRAIQKLAARLKVGGILLVIDWTPIDGSTPAQQEYKEELARQNKSPSDSATKEHPARHTVSTPGGFTERDLRSLFATAGCESARWKLAEELSPIPVVDIKAQLFWARATKVS